MNKQRLIDLLLSELQQTLSIATRAADDARDLATHEQSKPETQYDTVGLEASYLAHGQSQRVAELKLDLMLWQNIGVKYFESNDVVAPGALVLLETDDESQAWYLVGPAGGGLQLSLDDQQITVVTQAAPLGKALLGKQVDDEIQININDVIQHYDIVGID